MTKISDWATKHPELTKDIMEFLVVFGGLLTGLAALSATPNLTADEIVTQIGPVLASEGQDENSLPVAVGANTSNPFLL